MKRWCLGLLLLLACSSPIPEARFERAEIIGTRRTILVVRPDEADSYPRALDDYCDPSVVNPRISPRPGETLRMEFLTAAPNRVAPASWSFVVCASDGITCAGAPLLIATQPTPQEGPIAFDLPIPLDFSSRIAVLGAVCFGGRAIDEIDENTSEACEAEGDGSLLFARIDLDVPLTPNTQPIIDLMELNGQPLSEPVLHGSPCSDALPRVHMGEPGVVDVWMIACSVDTRLMESGAIITESPVANAYPTEGILPQPARFVPTEPGPNPDWYWYRAALELDTTTAEALPPEGRAVSLTIVASDLFGGDDVRHVGFCLLP